MADLPQADDDTITEGDAPPASPAPRRGPGHRAADARDTAAEMAQRAHEISLEAGSKMAGAMREVIGAAAGFSPFAIESARDLINYMVRRGQMGQEEAEVLIQQAEAAYIAKHGSLPIPGNCQMRSVSCWRTAAKMLFVSGRSSWQRLRFVPAWPGRGRVVAGT